ncbi:hypothetical protein G4B88_030890 [Cannabis sativa]|uniref:Uncharacterized protein n=1 Tax=Cannabis sativa TaxID=3483 RepID=A0A7J6DW68_CANSA|nr:hypothetical protein G4B88_030890 [Cannabis sativa]
MIEDIGDIEAKEEDQVDFHSYRKTNFNAWKISMKKPVYRGPRGSLSEVYFPISVVKSVNISIPIRISSIKEVNSIVHSKIKSPLKFIIHGFLITPKKLKRGSLRGLEDEEGRESPDEGVNELMKYGVVGVVELEKKAITGKEESFLPMASEVRQLL